MPVYKVKVKWGKELFSDVEANTDEDLLVFKAQLFALTGVHPNRQKIVVKGANIKEWNNVKMKDGATLMLMGSKDEDVSQVPVTKPVFVEDMSENELATALDLPAGLTNLGNTCYMNATVQCLKTVPELREALKKYTGIVQLGGPEGILPAQSVTAALRDLYSSMDRGNSVPPFILLQVLQMAFPRFAEKSSQGDFQQQDASECWTELVRMLQQKLSPIEDGNPTNFKSFIEQFFGGTFVFEMKCTESEEEAVTYGKEDFLQLSCFISTDVKYMLSGLKNKLQEQITKQSPTLGRDAVYLKSSKINRLPAYLTIQFVRFFYKEKGSINAKILKDIKFPLEFDAFELCTSELQEKLAPMRARFKEFEDTQVEESLKNKRENFDKKNEDSKKAETEVEPYWFSDGKDRLEFIFKTSAGESEAEKFYRRLRHVVDTFKRQKLESAKLPSSSPACLKVNEENISKKITFSDLGSNSSGYYSLQAVLTHKGRTSSSGHYVAWIKQKPNLWLKCDDDVVSPVTEEDVLKLSGGGDWHCAYVLLYGPKLLERPTPSATATNSSVSDQ